jgi:tetratricopeptide (TPR) repeat protein
MNKLTFFFKGVDLYPENEQALGYYAWFLDISGSDFIEVENYYLKSIDINPTYINSIQNYAITLYDRKLFEKAEHVIIIFLFLNN